MHKRKLRGDLWRADYAYGTRLRGDAPVAYQTLTLTQHNIEYLRPPPVPGTPCPRSSVMHLISRDSSN